MSKLRLDLIPELTEVMQAHERVEGALQDAIQRVHAAREALRVAGEADRDAQAEAVLAGAKLPKLTETAAGAKLADAERAEGAARLALQRVVEQFVEVAKEAEPVARARLASGLAERQQSALALLDRLEVELGDADAIMAHWRWFEKPAHETGIVGPGMRERQDGTRELRAAIEDLALRREREADWQRERREARELAEIEARARELRRLDNPGCEGWASNVQPPMEGYRQQARQEWADAGKDAPPERRRNAGRHTAWTPGAPYDAVAVT
jgi:hypothetical protein